MCSVLLGALETPVGRTFGYIPRPPTVAPCFSFTSTDDRSPPRWGSPQATTEPSLRTSGRRSVIFVLHLLPESQVKIQISKWTWSTCHLWNYTYTYTANIVRSLMIENHLSVCWWALLGCWSGAFLDPWGLKQCLWMSVHFIRTPLQINMEPQNHWVVEETGLPQVNYLALC